MFVSTSDPDSRVSRKQGKLPALNHWGIISVDTENHVICGAMADFANKKDSDTTEKNGIGGINLKKLLAFKTYKKAATIAIKGIVADLKMKVSLIFEIIYFYLNYKKINPVYRKL